MNYVMFLDKVLSNTIVYVSYSLIFLFCYICSNYFEIKYKEITFCLTYGVIVLAFLFFGNKIVYGLILSQISFYFVSQHYDLDLFTSDYAFNSLFQLICLPITIFTLKKFNITIGAGKNYKLDKTNIYHVLLITFISIIVLGALLKFSSQFFYSPFNLFTFTFGSFLGGSSIIILMKLFVNIPKLFKRCLKTI